MKDMPVPAFEWKTYSVSVPRQSPLRAFAAAAPAPAAEAVTVEIPLPVIDEQWPAPIDKARILLESAAEIEHALMAQYLYAAYSLKEPNDRRRLCPKAAAQPPRPKRVVSHSARDRQGGDGPPDVRGKLAAFHWAAAELRA